MRLVLSRKGFDSAAGGCASPIFPDGRLLSLPIPYAASPVTYADISYDGEPLGRTVEELTRGRVRATDASHLDPDLTAASLPRLPGWRGAFGQINGALTHLDSQDVEPGDLFLFFGWFREVERSVGKWRFRRGAPDRHVLFGWLQVGEVLRAGASGLEVGAARPWLAKHPHVHFTNARNAIYVAAGKLDLGTGKQLQLPGAGVFQAVSDGLVLTAPAQSRSQWHLPAWFYPGEGRRPLSSHTDLSRWTRGESVVALQTVGRGQEFVLQGDDYPEAAHWAEQIISLHA